MSVLLSTLGQMVVLFGFIAIGFILAKIRYLPKGAAGVLSKLESSVFIPALVLGTFAEQFTLATLQEAWKLLLFSLGVEILIIPLGILLSRLSDKNAFIRKIYTYGLCFSNFGFMGNAVVKAIFPDVFLSYLIFTLPLWTLIYVWGVPSLLVPADKKAGHSKIKALINPMFIALLIGLVIGLTSLPVPAPLMNVITVCGDCMSPIAMILTGITVAEMDLFTVLKRKSIYAVTLFRLLLLPLLFGLVAKLLPLPDSYYICLVASLAMPLGLNTVVIPASYGEDTSAAAGMALVSHILSIITIPLIFLLLL